MSEVQKILENDPTGKLLVDLASKIGTDLGKSLKTNQIRNIFTEIRKTEALWGQDEKAALRKLVMLKPKLAYQASRQRQVEPLKNYLTQGIDTIANAPAEKQSEYFKRFINFFEAILAYHRTVAGGEFFK